MVKKFISSLEATQSILEDAIEGILIAEIESKHFKYANPAVCRMFGYSSEEFLGLSVREIHPPEHLQTVLGFFESQARGDIKLAPSVPCQKKNGTTFWADINTSKVIINGIACNVGFFSDVTERKQAEEELRKSKEVLELIFKISPDASVITRMSDGLIVDINERFLTMSGYARQELIGKTSVELNLYEDADSRRKIVEELGKKGYYENFETVFRTKSGSRITGIMSSQIVALHGAPHIYSIIRDITERKRMEEALKRSEALFSSAFRMSSAATILSRLEDGMCIDANEAYAQLVGFSRDELVGRTTNELNIWMSPDERNRIVSELAQSRRLRNVPITLRKKDGSLRSTIASGEILTIEGRRCILSFFYDITERKRAEVALQESEEKYRSLIETTGTGYLILDWKGLVIDANREYVRLSGHRELREILGRSVIEWTADYEKEKNTEAVAKCVTDGFVRNLSIDYVDSSGRVTPIEISATVQGKGEDARIFSICRDITERKKTELLLINAQKLESLGVLAGGIAHDFNNLLAGIFGYIDLIRSLSKDAQTTEYLVATLATLNRAKALTLQLLTFAKGGTPVQKITSLIPFIQDAVQFALSGSNISCRFSLTENLWPCNIDKNQIGQVIDNIVINAQQAMPNGGTIEITAQNIPLGEKAHPSLAKGDYVKVSFKDFGIGIPKDIMPRIFDPFYTTKTKGHGLGLATCYSIINRHGGCIDVESEPGKGSTFHVYLPASTETVAVDAATIIKHTGCGTIIVVDDEETVRTTVRKMLESLGYAVVCNNDGREAVDFFINGTRSKRQFAAMIFDLTIPGGMGGIEAVTEIRKLNKEIPVFVVSGYADDSAMNNPAEYGFSASISKPFTIAELSEMLNRFLKP